MKHQSILKILAFTSNVFAKEASAVTGPADVSNAAMTTAAADPEYTSSLLSELWDGITVKKGKVTTTVPGDPVPTEDMARPPNMPEFESHLTLPKDFMWGMAASAYQIEGAADADGKGPSTWDILAHKVPGSIKNNDTGDVAVNHYYRFKEDAQRMKALGVPHYDLTISWPRIFPFGNGTVNEKGLQHYIDEVNYLSDLGIEPTVTLYHWDTPHQLQIWYGGWLDEKIVDDFAHYARTMYDALGDKVKHWFTINEPQVFCEQLAAYPGVVPDEIIPMHGFNSSEAKYTCGHHALLAHAKAVQIFRDEVVSKHPDRRISYKNSWQISWPQKSQDEDDCIASNRTMDFIASWFSKPIHVDGDYPQSMKDTLGDLLPEFTEEQKQAIKGSADFYAWDGYTGNFVVSPDEGVEACIKNSSHPLWPICSNVTYVQEDGWAIGQHGDVGSPWLYNTPEIFRQGVNWAWKNYNLSEIMVAEFGTSVDKEADMSITEARYDALRVNYFDNYLHTILKIIHEDKINFTGAVAWSALDNLEWVEGFSTRFGLQYVDYETEKRYYKKSAFYFSDFFKHYIRKY